MSRRFEVRLTDSAEQDLVEIFRTHRSDLAAGALLDELLESIPTLERHPARGSFPEELAQLGIKEYRQILLRQYRLIYRILEETVVIMVIADRRRDMQILLERRLLEH